MENFYNFTLNKNLQDIQKKNTQHTFVDPVPEDGSVLNMAGTFFANSYSSNNSVPSSEKLFEKQMILDYRVCSMASDVEMAIEEIVNEAIPTEDNNIDVTINLDKLSEIETYKNNPKLLEKIKKEIFFSHKKVLNLLDFHIHGDSIFRDWYIDGRLFFQKIYDEKNQTKGITGLKKIDALYIYKVFELIKNIDLEGKEYIAGTKEYFVYDKNIISQTDSFSKEALKIDSSLITYVTSGKVDPSRTFVYSHLHKVLKPLRNVQMLEDIQMIWRIGRAPERKAFFVDIGNKRGPEAERYLKFIMDSYKQKAQYDRETGTLKDDKRFMSILDDYYFPVTNGQNNIKVETIGGEKGALSDTEDIDRAKKNLLRTLEVPTSRLDNDSPFSFGKGSQLTLEEVKFKKHIDKLRRQFSTLFVELTRDDLALRNVIKSNEWDEIRRSIRYNFNGSNTYEEQKALETYRETLAVLSDADMFVGRYFSREDILKNVLRLSEEQINNLNITLEEERNLPEYLRPIHEVEKEKQDELDKITLEIQKQDLQQNSQKEVDNG